MSIIEEMYALLSEEGARLEEATTSMVPTMLRNAINMLDDKLKPRAKKYGADQVSVTGLAKGIEVTIWLDGPEEEARDSAKVILGSDFSLEAHKLKKNYYVAKVLYTLADIF